MKKIANLLILAGIVVFIGCAGSSDLGQLSMRTIFQNCLLGAIYVIAGCILKSVKIRKKAENHCKIFKLSVANTKNIKFPV